MWRRNFAVRLVLVVCCAGALVLSCSLAVAQSSRAASGDATSEISQLLEQGEVFERSRRWGEALGHYESAIKQHPDFPELKERLDRSRMHFDVARRYADTSFVQSVTGMTTADALALYGEVLLKIHTHYYEAPQWSVLRDRGIHGLAVALSDPEFLTQHLKEVPAARVAEFQAQLPLMTRSRLVRSRSDLQQLSSDVAYRAAQELGLSEPAAIMEFACGAMGALDEYSSFLTSAQLDDVFSQIEGNFVGLGVELKTLPDALEVVGVIEGSPAASGGIKQGDRIIGVDGRSARDESPDALADRLKGPEGTSVRITLAGPDQVVRQLTLMRHRVDVPSVDRVSIIDRNQGIGYFRITSFQKTTSRDVDAALWRLHREGMRYLIIDVRGNPGGLLTGAVEVADKFLTQGTIVSTRGRSAQEDFDYKAHSPGTWRMPLAVLIDGDSASASEIFAGAIRDSRRGTIIGERSYGKGSVQGIFPLGVSKAGVRITTAKFFSPSGQAISHRGVTPDLTVRVAARPVVNENGNLEPVASQRDAALEASLSFAREQLAKR
jgi:carboxyl-terminal processing protease